MPETSTIDRIRERVVRIAQEIERASKEELAIPDFFSRFLQMVVGALAARGGIVWLLNQEGKLVRVTHTGEADSILQGPAAQLNQQLLGEVLSQGQARCVCPSEDDPEAPIGELLVLGPLHDGENCVGVVEILQRGTAPGEARPGYLQFLEQMCGYASRFLARRKDRARQASEVNADSRPRLHEFVLRLQSTRDFREVAATAVNDSRLLLECDRVSLAWNRGRKTVIEAISGQDRVNHRANLVRNMAELASRVIPTGEPFIYAGDVENLPPQIEKPLSDYVAESGSRQVILVPLLEPEPVVTEDDEDLSRSREKRPPKPLGCLVVERVSDSEPDEQLLGRSRQLAGHVAASLENARAFERIFLRRPLTALGRCREWLHGRKLLITLAVVLGLTAVVGGLTLVEWDYRVEAEGRLMPSVQHAVFAPWEGEVVEVYVSEGETVRPGQELLRIRNDELQSKWLEVRNQKREKEKQIVALRAQIDLAVERAEGEEAVRVKGQLVEAREELQGLTRQADVLQTRVSQLTVTAPESGTVATFQLEQTLENRPVERGEILLELMDERSPWRLELEVEEHRMGHLLQAVYRHEDNDEAAQPAEPKQHLPVEFILATATEETYEARLDPETIATRPRVAAEKGSVVEAFASLAEKRPADPRIGAEVRAKINCGKKSLGYVLFGDVVEFVRQRLWL